jgi:hypothetical protein
MVAGLENPLHVANAEHRSTVEKQVLHRLLLMGATTATGQSLDLGEWSCNASSQENFEVGKVILDSHLASL